MYLHGVFRRFSRWSIKGVWWRIFEAMSDDPDFEYLIVDSTIVRARQPMQPRSSSGSGARQRFEDRPQADHAARRQRHCRATEGRARCAGM
jgi:transposase